MRTGGRMSPRRWLDRLPTGTHVQLSDGSVWTKALTRWLAAGTNGQPVASAALLFANQGVTPVVLMPVTGTGAAA